MFDNILYEDNHLLMVEKPINVPVQEDNSRDQDLLSILKNYIKVQYNKPGNVYLGLVPPTGRSRRCTSPRYTFPGLLY